MALTLDHIIIAVPDVEAAAEQLGHALGLMFAPPSYHTGSGTYNRMGRFANGTSIELLGSSEHGQPATVGGATHDLSYFDNGPSQFGFALRSDDLPALVAASKERGGSLSEPEPRAARLPDGTLRSWIGSNPTEVEGEQFLVVPFVIQYIEGWGAELWRTQGLLEHEMDYGGVAGVSVTAKPDYLNDIYKRNFGREFVDTGLENDPFCELDGGFIEALTINPDQGGGSYQPFYPPQVHTIFLRVSDLHDAATKLRAWKVEFVEDLRFAGPALRIDPQVTMGLPFALVSEE